MLRILVCALLLTLFSPALADTGSRPLGNVSSEADRWQRIDFLPVRLPLRTASQIKVAIQTNGPSMQGLIRIPGGIASNFDTGAGTTVVDLINVGNDTTGYADVVAVEVLLTRSMPNQSFQVFTVD
jgi:hypothetical protein